MIPEQTFLVSLYVSCLLGWLGTFDRARGFRCWVGGYQRQARAVGVQPICMGPRVSGRAMTHNPRECDSCRSCSPCPDWEASRALPRRAIRICGQDVSLTEAELFALRSRVTEAILELEAERNG
jgi:hypothetical protein